MHDLLTNYSLEQIIMFVVILALALKGLIDFYDWAKKRFNAVTTKEHLKLNEKASIKEDIDKLYQIQVTQNESIDKLTQSVNLLLQSDKDEIKAWITEKHHYFCYELKCIDDFSLDCIEKRFAHYKDEGGNSFIAALMAEIRALPKVSMLKEIEMKNKKK